MITFSRMSWYNVSQPYIIIFSNSHDKFFIATFQDLESFLKGFDKDKDVFLIIDRASSKVLKQGKESFRLLIAYITNKDRFLNPPEQFVIGN